MMDNEALMREALNEAQKALYMTYPNPRVGALLVVDGTIMARGYHHEAGGPHAEVECLRNAREKGIDPKGATLVVTLEPCKHMGKTPPCTEAILSAGIDQVVIGTSDPTPEAGGGAEILESNGVRVIRGVLEEECRELIRDFLLWKTEKRPFVILKMAETMDGRIATRTGHSQWISSPESRVLVHRLRSMVAQKGGLILIGGKTFRQDNPSLTVRLSGEENTKSPLACVFTSHLPNATDDYFLIRERPGETIFLSSAAAAASPQAAELRKIGVRVFPVPQFLNGSTDLKGLLRQLYAELSCPYILCEGGGFLGLSLLEEGLVDEFHLHLAPLFLADNEALPLFSGKMPLSLQEGMVFRTSSISLCGPDVHIVLRPKAGE
ncbi:MAG: bifunctional diaminohydroxyphosphoribosylaminopyrimidine deaminase/5-amino-6-(5-phosphoribosylamino)uracil reductase RibD [Desulfovibrio sp.]|nr:bifunctional diaminohydroxyphosphoribosylaminopyrimidine deaminase/5-amino-6-(5-phosphoribosylamino)uracil reductase RibD [Desulfovibrio sp.]